MRTTAQMAMLLPMASIDDQSTAIVLADSATKLGDDSRGAVIVTGSHGGRYAAYLTLRMHPRAVIHNDAGVGKDEAGIAVLYIAQALGVAAATASNQSCRIGDAADMMARGKISRANDRAASLGVAAGMACKEAASLLAVAKASGQGPEPCREVRRVVEDPMWRRRIVLIDSASLVLPQDVDQIVVAASHGALIGGSPRLALQVDAFAAVFNDAGVGADHAGIGRLAALDTRGIAALTVASQSARIGDALSSYEDGTISHANRRAAALGARLGDPLRSCLVDWASRP